MIRNNERIVWADSLRVMATFGVILLHTASTQWGETPVSRWNWQMMNLYDSCVRWTVPVFFMLSGMTFLNPEKEITIKSIYKKYILRLVTALIFWGGIIYGLIRYNFFKI